MRLAEVSQISIGLNAKCGVVILGFDKERGYALDPVWARKVASKLLELTRIPRAAPSPADAEAAMDAVLARAAQFVPPALLAEARAAAAGIAEAHRVAGDAEQSADWEAVLGAIHSLDDEELAKAVFGDDCSCDSGCEAEDDGHLTWAKVLEERAAAGAGEWSTYENLLEGGRRVRQEVLDRVKAGLEQLEARRHGL